MKYISLLHILFTKEYELPSSAPVFVRLFFVNEMLHSRYLWRLMNKLTSIYTAFIWQTAIYIHRRLFSREVIQV